LWEDRVAYLDRLGDAVAAQAARTAAAQIQPANARDHYLLATTYARGRSYAQAVGELDCALRLNPRDYWSSIQRGICHQEMGQYTLAAADFGASIGLWPEFAWGYFNRGYVLNQSGHKAEALNDYTAALEREPGFVLAYLNRGMIHLELKQFAPALADFRKAAELGHDEAPLHAGLGAALEGLGKHAEADQAFQIAFARAKAVNPETVARIQLVYGFAVAARLPAKAHEAFADVLRQAPAYRAQALYGRAMLLVETGQTREALACFNQAVEAAPTFMEARRFRAVLLARAGQFDGACPDINWCLEREPEAGATLYAAACVTALWVERSGQVPSVRGKAVEAIQLLRKAFRRGYGQDKAAEDPDLKGLRGVPEFDRLLQEAIQSPGTL
jgi:tetratricopeptide (TPR) repeat protein